ncbi:unnamed protein product [Heligmosomoides polygyrus]|uniref:CVNH domain-containing protein n=1 Tax=Heligmosomoides polygyrus TaxID=6339 RepID=A0A183GM52_HELPZ|nr:unnamed protein product [Heligmosomoides polygyrus]
MLRVAVLVALSYVVYSQYGVPPAMQPGQYYGAPLYPPPQYAPPVVLQPIRLPEYPAPPQFLIPRRRHHHHHHDDSRPRDDRDKDCMRCRRLIDGCWGPSAVNCTSPIVDYLQGRDCKAAIVSCAGAGAFELQTSTGALLSNGTGIEKLIKCNKYKKWTATDIKGERIGFDSLKCMIAAE